MFNKIEKWNVDWIDGICVELAYPRIVRRQTLSVKFQLEMECMENFKGISGIFVMYLYSQMYLYYVQNHEILTSYHLTTIHQLFPIGLLHKLNIYYAHLYIRITQFSLAKKHLHATDIHSIDSFPFPRDNQNFPLTRFKRRIQFTST